MTETKNEIAVVEGSRFTAIAAGMAAVKENLAATGESLSASDLIRVPTPTGGSTTWMIPGPGGDEATPHITGVLCFYQRCGILWPSFDPTPGAIPVLRSFDLCISEQVGPIPDSMHEVLEACRLDERHFDWETCGYNQFGSGKNGIGKRCREQRLLFILRENSLLPLLVTVQPGSLRNVVRFVKSLGLAAQIPYYRSIVDLSLEKVINRSGQAFSRIVPKLVGMLDAAAGEQVLRLWTGPLQAIVTSVAPEVDKDEE